MKHKNRAKHKKSRKQTFWRSYNGSKAQKEHQQHMKFKREWHIDAR